MTCSIRCSSNRALAVAAALTALVSGGGCGHGSAGAPPVVTLGAPEPGTRPKVVLLPIDNLADTAAPVKDLRDALAATLSARVDVLTGDALERFLSRHRVRYTGGIDAAVARAAREELGADALLVTSMTIYKASNPPALGLTVRLVSAEDEPAILWMDSFAFAGDQAPGLLGLGRVERFGRVQDRVLSRLARGLGAFLDGERRDAGCDGRGYGPKVRYRSPALDGRGRRTLAVVPFLDHSKRDGAGEAVALEFVRQLVATGRFRVLEPGVVRDYMLRARMIMPGGVSLETTRLMVGHFGVELVLSGLVLDYEETGGKVGSTVRFRATMLDGETGDVVWNSSSYNRGDDGVFLFQLGRVGTSQDLTCRMVTSVVDRLGRPGGTPVSWARQDERDPRQFTRPAREARAAQRSGSGSGSTR
jgi:TolB-like protein